MKSSFILGSGYTLGNYLVGTNQMMGQAPRSWKYVAQTKMHFLVMLNFPYLMKLTNDLVLHDSN
jgi:hypothetical protein